MSARNGWRSVMLACLGTMTGATSVLAATGKIHLTAQQQSASSSNLDQALGSLGGGGNPSPTVATTSTPTSGGAPTPGSTPVVQHTVKPSPTKSKGKSGSFTGQSVDDGWASFQVQLTVASGKITDSQVVGFSPYNGGSRISMVQDYLREEVLTTKSVDCTQISGATYSCMAYADSLASAISRAGI